MRQVTKDELIAYINEVVDDKDLRKVLRTYVQGIALNTPDEVIAVNIHKKFCDKVRHYGAHACGEFEKYVEENYP